MLVKQKSPLLPRNLALGTSGELLIVFSRKVNLLPLVNLVNLIPPLFNDLEVLSSASDKGNLFAQNFIRTLIVVTQVPLYLFSLLELIWNYIFL